MSFWEDQTVVSCAQLTMIESKEPVYVYHV